MSLLMPDELEKKKREQGLVDTRTPAEAVQSLLFPEPLTPLQQANEKYGAGETILRRLGNLFTGGLFDSVIIPELSSGNRDKYETNLALWQKQQEMNLVDAQDEAYAQALLDPNTTPAQRMAAAARAGGVGEVSPNGYTLSPGQIRYDAVGGVEATGGAPVVNPTAVMQNAEATAQGYGIPVGSQAYSDLIAAYAEPSGSQTLADGTVVPFNTVDKVIADWKAGNYNQSQQSSGGQSAGTNDLGVTPGGGVTPEGARGGTVRGVMNKEIAENLKIADQKISFYNDLEGVISNFGEWDPDANDGEGGFVANEATRDNYGSIQNHPLYPGSYEFFKGDDEKDSLVFMDQLVDMLTVDERGKLKGQGQITEGETAMLKRAVTTLQNRNLSDEAMQRELAKLMRGLIARRQKFIDLQNQYGKDGQGGNTADDFDTMWDNS